MPRLLLTEQQAQNETSEVLYFQGLAALENRVAPVLSCLLSCATPAQPLPAMPRLAHRHPAYRLHRASGQAVVTLDRHTVYLGPFDTPASRRKYDQVIGQWLAGGRRWNPAPAASGPTVDELIRRYLEHAHTYYRR